MTRLYSFDTPLQLVGGGSIAPHVLNYDMPLIAADGGADVVLAAGLTPYAVIGDLDSLTTRAKLDAQGVPVHHIREQDSTDLEKCLQRVSAPLIVGNGFLGKRIDHTLGALSVVSRFHDTPIILTGNGEIAFIWRENLSLDLQAGTPVSFFPFNQTRGLSCAGLVWPITGLDFAPYGQIGTLNKAKGGAVTAAFSAPMMTILSAEYLDMLVENLRASSMQG